MKKYITIFLLCIILLFTSCVSASNKTKIYKDDNGYIVEFSRSDLRKIKKKNKDSSVVGVESVGMDFRSVAHIREFFIEESMSYEKAAKIYYEFDGDGTIDKNRRMYFLDFDNLSYPVFPDYNKLEYYIVNMSSPKDCFIWLAGIVDKEWITLQYSIYYFDRGLFEQCEHIYNEADAVDIDGYKVWIEEYELQSGGKEKEIEFEIFDLPDGKMWIRKSYTTDPEKDKHSTELQLESIEVIREQNELEYKVLIFAYGIDYSVDWIIENTRLMPYDEAYEQQILDKAQKS